MVGIQRRWITSRYCCMTTADDHKPELGVWVLGSLPQLQTPWIIYHMTATRVCGPLFHLVSEGHWFTSLYNFGAGGFLQFARFLGPWCDQPFDAPPAKQADILFCPCPFVPNFYTWYLTTERLNVNQTCTTDTAHSVLHFLKFSKSGFRGQVHKILCTGILLKPCVHDIWWMDINQTCTTDTTHKVYIWMIFGRLINFWRSGSKVKVKCNWMILNTQVDNIWRWSVVTDHTYSIIYSVINSGMVVGQNSRLQGHMHQNSSKRLLCT